MAPAPSLRHDTKLLASSRTKLRLAALSVGVLVVGSLIAPRAQPTALSPSTERPAMLLEEQVQRQQAAAQTFLGVDEVADTVSPHAVQIHPPGQAAVSTATDFTAERPIRAAARYGVFVSDRYVLTHADALDGRSDLTVVSASGTAIDARVAAYDPPTGLVLLDAPSDGPPAAVIASAPPPAGALVVGAGGANTREAAVPLFVQSTARDRFFVGTSGVTLPAGLPLYDLDGQLIGLSTGSDDAGVLRVAAATDRLLERASRNDTPAAFGVGLQAIDSSLAAAFGDRGVLVSDVLPDSPAAGASIAPGDVLVSIGDVAVNSVDDAAGALSVATLDQPVPLTVVRGGRERTVEVTPAPAYDLAVLAAVRGDATAPVTAGALFAPPVLEAAGIRPAARLLEVNGTAVRTTVAATRALRARPAATIIRVYDDGRRYFAVIGTQP